MSAGNHKLNTPEISVVIAAFNSESTLRQALESVFRQSIQTWEIVIVDDASTDETGRILSEFDADWRFQIITNATNLGSGKSRNIAFEAARADFVAVLDADDLMLPMRLELQIAEFKKNAKLDALGSQIAEFGTWGGPQMSAWPVSEADVSARQRARKMPIAHCAAMFRKAAVLNVGGYDEACRRAQDYALMLKLQGSLVTALPQVLTLYRTIRPLPLSYAIMSGRYGNLARLRSNPSSNRKPKAVQTFPRTLLIDARSTITWLRRRLAES